MRIICSPSGIVSVRRPGQGIGDIADAGFKNISMELSMCCSGRELERYGEPKDGGTKKEQVLVSEEPAQMRNFLHKMAEACHDRGLEIPVMRAPYLLRDTKRTDLAPQLIKIYQEAMRYCIVLGCRYIVIRPLFSGIRYGKEWETNREFYMGLTEEARKNHVTVLLENQYYNRNGGIVRGLCSDAAQAAAWVDGLNEAAGEERFGFCMDAGTCSLCGQNMQDFVCRLGKRLKAVILRDCDGHREASMLPFTCSGFQRSGMDWLGLIRGLRQIDFDGEVLLNFSTTASAFSPLLRPCVVELAKKTGDYFKWQIGLETLLKKHGSVVLFGAGNMCRNYMKCYGEKYPPLFTCDNNQKLWGTNFCGLEVKPPESLKELPQDCVIFICNIYYREIRQQLRDMGIDNEIEFFSDEFMPSFYFDRIERGE